MRYLLLLLLLSLSAPFLFGQLGDNTPYYKGFQSGHAIYHWTTSNGLPQSHIAGMTQTPDKLLWIATYDGVIQFDGRKFVKADARFNNKETSSFVTAIQSRGDTLIWANTQEIILYHNHRIIAVHPIRDPGVFIASILVYKDRYYFISHNGIYCLRNNKLSAVVKRSTEKGFAGKFFHTAARLGTKLICLASDDEASAICTIDLLTGKKQTIRLKQRTDNLSVIDGKLLFQLGAAWYRTVNYGPTTPVHRAQISAGEAPVQSSLFAKAYFYYTKSALVIGRGSGQSELNVSEIMHDNQLFSSFVDHTGNLWLGTNSLGLFMFRAYPFNYVPLSDQPFLANSSHAFVDREKLLWFDNDCDLTVGVDLRTNRVMHSLPHICNWVDTDWSKDTIALFAFGLGHHWYNKQTKTLSDMQGVDFPVNNCYRLAPRLFMLGADGGMFLWDGKKTTLWKQFRSSRTTCNQILSAGPHAWYFATSEGLYHFKAGTWKLVTGKGMIDKPDFRSLHKVANTPYLLIGTAGNGILRYNRTTGELRKLKRIPFQLQNCWSMVEDHFGQLWVTSNNGIVQLNMSDLNQSFEEKSDFLLINHYRYETGIQNVEFNSRTQNKGSLLPDGKILFSSLGGPVFITPLSNGAFNRSLGYILLEKIAVNEQVTDPSIRQLELIEGDFVQLQFTLPSFSLERVLMFEYRIKGYRNEWSAVSNRQITLDNLPKGNYQLEIRLTSGKRSLQLPVHVSAEYPNLWILYLLVGLIIGVVVILITADITRSVQRRKNAANSMKQQLKILEMEALRSQMNPHFIFNCLNTIQFLFISGNVDRANKYLSDFSSLMRMTLDLLRTPMTSLDIELKATMLYVELEQLQFDNGFELRLINNLQTPVNRINTPTLFFQIFVENAVIHGLKKTTEPAPILTIILDETDEHFIFRVCDNGPGISEHKKEDHTSLGLALLRERLALKNEIYNWDIAFQLQERKSLENDIRTEIIITFGKILNEPAEHENPDSR